VELAATLVAQGITSFAEVQRAMLDDDVAERQPRVSVATPGFRGGASEDTVDGAWAPVVDAASFAALDGQDVVEDLEIDSDLAPSPAGPPLLLVIDASSEAARRLDRAIPSGEIRLLTARTVDDGIALAARERPDALVLRALGDAAATAPRIRRFKEEAATRDLPILIVTKDDAGVREFLHRGASAVITAVMDGAQVRDILRSTVPVSAGPR
jgi:CheY-like chemotaxis protein